MPQVEIDENQLMTLQRNTQLLANALQSPKARDTLLRALKAGNPDLPIPEIDAKEPVLEELNKLREEMSAFKGEMTAAEAKREEEKQQSQLQAKWQKGRDLAQKNGYVGDGLEELEKFMEEKGVADHEIAIAAFERLHPPQKPVESTSGRFNLFEKPSEENKLLEDYLKQGANNEGMFEAAVDQELRKIRGMAA